MSISSLAAWDRVAKEVEKVRERLLKTARTLEAACVPYCVIGGNAVQVHVGRVDPAAVRNTRDVDILLRRVDLPRAIVAMEAAGFIYRHADSIDMFLDGRGAKARDAVHVLFANEKVRQEYLLPTPDVDDCDDGIDFRTVSLEALLKLKLTSFRKKDQVHVLDMLDVELIDASWVEKLPPGLGERLQQLIDDPDG